MDGVLLIDKPAGFTSFDLVAVIRKQLNIKKVGHIGTLDPNATGLMIVLVGKATKFSQFLIKHEKTYQATLRLGLKTTTYDIWGEIIEERIPQKHDTDEIAAVLTSFSGFSEQIPPLYSAIKLNGKKLYEYARNQENLELKSRTIHIKSISLDNISGNDLDFTVTCSSGTYIRSLCGDIAAKLGELGTMSALKRTAIDSFQLAEAESMEDIKENKLHWRTIEEFLTAYPGYEYDDLETIKNGKAIELNSEEPELMIYHQGKAVAFYQKGPNGFYYCQRGLW